MVCASNVEAVSRRHPIPTIARSAPTATVLGKRGAEDQEEGSVKRQKLEEPSVVPLRLTELSIAEIAQRFGGAVLNAIGVTAGTVVGAAWAMSSAFGPGIKATMVDSDALLVRRSPLVLMKDSSTQTLPIQRETQSLTCASMESQMCGIEGTKCVLPVTLGDDQSMRLLGCEDLDPQLQVPQWYQKAEYNHPPRLQQEKMQQHPQLQFQFRDSMDLGAVTAAPQGLLPPALHRKTEMSNLPTQTRGLPPSVFAGQAISVSEGVPVQDMHDSCRPCPDPVSKCNVPWNTAYGMGCSPIPAQMGPLPTLISRPHAFMV